MDWYFGKLLEQYNNDNCIDHDDDCDCPGCVEYRKEQMEEEDEW